MPFGAIGLQAERAFRQPARFAARAGDGSRYDRTSSAAAMIAAAASREIWIQFQGAVVEQLRLLELLGIVIVEVQIVCAWINAR